MKLSKTQIVAFFLALLVLGWFLYPRAVFLAVMYEDSIDHERSETYYKRYLKKRPNNKFATLRLAKLYYRMAEPEKSTKLLKELSDYRYLDWDIAQAYLEHLKAIQDEDAYYKELRRKAATFSKSKHVHPEKLRRMLNEALQYAIWQQKHDEAYVILEKLIALGRNKSYYEEEKHKLDLASKDKSKIIKILTLQLKENPKHTVKREELITIYLGANETSKALEVADSGLELNPNNVTLLKSRAKIYEKMNEHEKAADDIKKALVLMEKSKKPKRDVTSQ